MKRTEKGERQNVVALLDDFRQDWEATAEREDLIQCIQFYRVPMGGRPPLSRRGEARIEVFYPTHRRALVQEIVWHSPDGFEFGYHGSGPADAALNILLLFVTEAEARRYHQDFKSDFVARIDQEKGGKISAKAIRNWLEDRLATHPSQQIWTAAERGVAIVLLGWDIETAPIYDDPRRWNRYHHHEDPKWPDFRGRRPWSCGVPKQVRYQVMYSKACAFMDGYYVAFRQTSELVRLSERFPFLNVPHYDQVKWRILDGDGFDDENVEGGDYILAARIALALTASRYPGLRDPDYVPSLGG